MSQTEVDRLLAAEILKSLTSSQYDWRTADGVAADTGLDVVTVVRELETSPAVVRADRPNSRGKALYRLKPKESLVRRFIGALANAPA